MCKRVVKDYLIRFIGVLPSKFSLSLMCWRLQPVSSRLSSGSGRYGSNLEWLFLRCFGLEDTQQDVVFPMVLASFSDRPKPTAVSSAFYPTVLLALQAGDGAVTRLARPGPRSKPSPVSVSVTHPWLKLRLQWNLQARRFKTTFKRRCRLISQCSSASDSKRPSEGRDDH